MNKQKIEKIFNKTISNPKSKIHEAVVYVESTDGNFSQKLGYGGRDIDTPMIIASISKMFTATCIIKLVGLGKLSLDEQVSKFFDKIIMDGLPNGLTISHLLFQTSGLPDYFTDKNSTINYKNIINGEDLEITFEQVIEETKKLKTKFAPNERAVYSDVNYDMLGKVLEKVTGVSVAEAFRQFIFEPLGMDDTYAPTADSFIPCAYYKDQKVHRAKYMQSCHASGGCVSTPADLMKFSKAFWGGKVFDKKFLDIIKAYKNPVFFPIYYGGGHMRIKVGGLMTAFKGKGDVIGHSGATGSFCFYYPHKDLHFVGDLAQMQNPALPVRMLLKLIMASG